MAKPKTKAAAQARQSKIDTSRQAKIDAAKKANSTGPNKIVVATIVAVLAIAAVVGVVVYNAVAEKNKITQGGKAVPAGAAGMDKAWVDNAFTAKSGVPVVTIYEDFRCPVCKAFEDAYGDTVKQLAKDGKIQLRYNFKTVIDGNFGSNNSQQAANNALCAADAAVYEGYHDYLYAHQPEEPNQFSKSDFTEAAKSAGLSGDKLATWQKCADAGKYMNYVKSTEDSSFKAGVTGTPAIYVNDTPLSWGTVVTADRLPDLATMTTILESGKIPDANVDTKLPKIPVS